MERTIFDIMSNHPSRIDDFRKACDDMLASQYILVGGRIASILMSIAVSKTLYNLMDRLLAGFDYKYTAKKCIREDGKGITLPASCEDATALVFCILLDIDKQNIELKDFLQFYQGDHEPSFAYKAFLAEFIAPFKHNVLALVDAEKRAETDRQTAEERENELRRLQLEFDRFMGTFMARINSDEGLNSIIKDDLTVLCYSFTEAVRGGNDKEIKVAFTRLRGKLRLHMPALAKELERFDAATA